MTKAIKPRKHGTYFWGVFSVISSEHGYEFLTLEFRRYIAVDPEKQLEDEKRWGCTADRIAELEHTIQVAKEQKVPYVGDSTGSDHCISVRWQGTRGEPGKWYAPHATCGFSKHAAAALSTLAKRGWSVTPEEAIKVLRAVFVAYDEGHRWTRFPSLAKTTEAAERLFGHHLVA